MEECDMKSQKSRFGFTLIELLVVIAIIAMLAAILFPVFLKARSKWRDAKCVSNLRQIGMAVREYNSDWNDRYMLEASAPGRMRSFVALLHKYVKSPKVFFCPSAPRKFVLMSSADEG